MTNKKHLVTDFFNIREGEAGPAAGQKNREVFLFIFPPHFIKMTPK